MCALHRSKRPAQTVLLQVQGAKCLTVSKGDETGTYIVAKPGQRARLVPQGTARTIIGLENEDPHAGASKPARSKQSVRACADDNCLRIVHRVPCSGGSLPVRRGEGYRFAPRWRCFISRLPLFVLPLFALAGCAKQIDRITVDRVVDRGTDYRDVDNVCAIGRALTHPLGSLTAKEPDLAMVVAEVVSGLCAQADAWEADLATVRAARNLKALGPARADEVVDAGLRAERLHARAAGRFERGWQRLMSVYPGMDQGDCPRIKPKDEFVSVLGMVGGVLALLHDRAAGGGAGVPFDRPLHVARATTCFPDDAWWSTMHALRAGSWATIPGSEPDGVDAWGMLEEAAVKGDSTGIRVARSMQVLLAANAGRDEVVADSIAAFAAVEAEGDPDWILLDEYARLVVLHQSDLVWTRERGHRTADLGVLPSDEATGLQPLTGEDDPFGAGDPFGDDADGTEDQEESP